MSKSTKSLVGILACFIFVNCLVFLIYRLIFLWRFASGVSFNDSFSIALYGFRIDLALLALQISLLALLAVLTRFLRAQLSFRLLWGLTYINLLVACVNLIFFQERNQHLWDMFLANIDSPKEIYVAMEPFVDIHPALAIIWVIFSFLFLFVGFRASRHLRQYELDLWKTGKSLRRSAGLILILLFLNLEPVAAKKTEWPLGWYPVIAASRHYMRFDNYLANQAVVNPIHDFLRSYLPGILRQHRQFQLERNYALNISRSLLDILSVNEDYPLLRKIGSRINLGIENVILIQVEGLSQSLIRYQVGGRYVMPYLQRLTEEGLYFPNVVQSFNSTDGSLFSTVTGFHEIFVERSTKDFMSYDLHGRYGSLTHILGAADYQHLFFQGFRQRYADFVSFMGNQDYTTYGFDYFRDLLRRKNIQGEVENALGIFDGILLQETANILLESRKKFTAHILTGTSHSPWAVPESFASSFGNNRLNVFHYVDKSIESFIKTLRDRIPQFDRTLFVIVGDHTSVTFDSNIMERIRVPLLFYSSKLSKIKDQWRMQQKVYGSHVDIVPTILALLGGEHCYGGMGKDLLSSDASNKGVISGSLRLGYYLKGRFVLKYSPYPEDMQLFAIQDDRVIMTDVSKQHPDILERMKLEYFAQYETSKRLTGERKIFPLDARGLCHASK